MKRIWAFVPLAFAVILGGFFYWGLNPDRDPNEIPSALLDQPLPSIALEPIPNMGTAGFDPLAISEHELALVNVFASWCVPCRAEHGPLTRLAEAEDLPIYGLNYKDQADAGAAWLAELGNPYLGIGFDLSGRAGIEWGISGVPETFIIKNGIVVYRHVGPIVGETATGQFMKALNAQRGS